MAGAQDDGVVSSLGDEANDGELVESVEEQTTGGLQELVTSPSRPCLVSWADVYNFNWTNEVIPAMPRYVHPRELSINQVVPNGPPPAYMYNGDRAVPHRRNRFGASPASHGPQNHDQLPSGFGTLDPNGATTGTSNFHQMRNRDKLPSDSDVPRINDRAVPNRSRSWPMLVQYWNDLPPFPQTSESGVLNSSFLAQLFPASGASSYELSDDQRVPRLSIGGHASLGASNFSMVDRGEALDDHPKAPPLECGQYLERTGGDSSDPEDTIW